MAIVTSEGFEEQSVPEVCITAHTVWSRLRSLSNQPKPCPICLFLGDFDGLFNGQPQYFDFVNPLPTSLPFYKAGAEKDKCPLCILEYRVLSTLSEEEIAKLKEAARQIDEERGLGRKFPGLFRLRSPGWGVYDKAWIIFEGGTRIPGNGIPRLPLLHGTNSPQAITFVNEQLEACVRNHTACKSNESGAHFLPSRLLYLGSTNNEVEVDNKDITIRLNADIPKHAKYAALSYCRGQGEQACFTRQENLDVFQKGISWETLPQTFQDAVTFTRKLGLKYLWIDALCIMQDDDADWLREVGSMLQIYQNAHVTLAGLFGRDPSAGLFSSKRADDLQKKLVRLRRGAEITDLYIREATPDIPGIIDAPTCEQNAWSCRDWPPLFTRAWALQERMVSPRVVHFAEDELVFECRTKVQCECLSHYTDSPSRKMVHARALNTAKPPAMSRLLLKQPEIDDWEDLVQLYSRLNLTHETDRLVAIGGLAQEYARFRPRQTYLAGLWSGSLVQGLLWETTGRDAFRPRPAKWVAPSWSWASAGSPVDFAWRRSVEQLQLKVAIKEASCKYVNGIPFGRLTEGTICLAGQLERARLDIRVYADQSRDESNWTYTANLRMLWTSHRREAFHEPSLNSILSPALVPGCEENVSNVSGNGNIFPGTQPNQIQEKLFNGRQSFTLKEDVRILKLAEGSCKSALTGRRTALYMILKPIHGVGEDVYTRIGTVTAEQIDIDEGRPDEIDRLLSRHCITGQVPRRVSAGTAEGISRALSNEDQLHTDTILLL
ncbi:heterokaryon incompatibility protein-domain-containing protein [Hypoxylon sp. NC1633]|nr:heterokaryon incompatibility protein-domain-containing protein [Hypoxylon sp. NC1633]